jgi:hypothetical protein
MPAGQRKYNNAVIEQIWEHPCPAYARLREKVKHKAEEILKGRITIPLDPIDIPVTQQKEHIIGIIRKKNSANREFAAMLPEEYILIDISLIICSPGWTNKAERQNIFSSSLTLLSSGSG